MAKKSTKKNNFDLKRLMDSSGSYKNLIYGVITVVILFVIIFLGVRTLSQDQGEIDEGATTVDESEEQGDYEVAEGDTLWSISENVYGTGFNWQVIAEANDLANPEDVETGDVLVIPELTPTESEVATSEEGEEPVEEETEESAPTATASPTPETTMEDEESESVPSTTEYTVQKGDNLWDIAQAQYNNGYKWVDIARSNDLDNPDIIHAGNVLVIPR